ncbi:MAG: hypothetical protein EBV03_09455 [Proteobacteria bacterium]|nr:hypothetical protein [Pseudomonadota bacterium]
MTASYAFVAPQHLHSVHQAIGAELSRTLDFLRHQLTEIRIARSPEGDREYAQLREAKALINLVKNAGVAVLARQDEIAWALHYVRNTYSAQMSHQGCMLLEKAAVMLDIDLLQPHPMPLDMARRIENELALLSRYRLS